MKRILFAIAIVVLVAPMYHPVYAQEESIDITGLLNGQGGGGRGGNQNRGPSIPDSKLMFDEIAKTLKNGKAPLDRAQEKPLRSLLDMEIVMLSDKIQLLRNGNGNNNQGFPGNPGQEDPRAGGRGGGRGGRGGGGGGGEGQQAQGNTQQQTQQQQQTAQRAAIETLANLKNDEFIDTQLALFLSPEQVALVKKAKADDKNNSTCLGGLFDRVSPNRTNQNQQNRGGNNNNNNYNNNNNNNTAKTNGQKYCMAADATAVARLEPIKKVLSNGKMPLTADKEPIAEAFMTANVSKLEDTIRTTLTGNNNQGGRGGNNNNFNNTKLNQTIRTSTDAIYLKVEAMLNPNQAGVLKTWHYTEMLGRSPIDSLIAVNAMQDTPLTDEQVAKVTAAWPELQKQVEKAADAAKTRITDKQRDATAMKKILDMLEPSQVASYELAKKYGPEAAAGNK